MTELMTQRQVEEDMYHYGVARTKARIKNAEEKGEAARNPYAATVFRDFVLPLAHVLHEEVMQPSASKRAAHAQLLRTLDLEAVALLAVRAVLSHMLGPEPKKLRVVGYTIGKLVHCELVLAQIEHINPDLYHTLANDFGRRRSRDVRHRMTVFKMQAEKAGIHLDEWTLGARDQVGLYLLEQLARLGLVSMDPAPTRADGSRMPGKRAPLEVYLTEGVIQTIDSIKGMVEVTTPMYGPCVEPPHDWTAFNVGGFHTPALRRVHPYLVKAHGAARGLLGDHYMPTVLAATNALQRTAWAINTRMLDTVIELAKTMNLGEVVTMRDAVKPAPPAWLADKEKGAELSVEQDAEFLAWKREMADWYTKRKIQGVSYGRFYAATRTASTFRDYPALHFVYFADSRGRLYPLTYGVNPQGSDMQKALLHFATGKKLDTPAAVKWFLIQGANKYGFDKATLAEREAWHKDKHQVIMAIASDPVNRMDWQEADSPLQFLAWCFEYAEWQIDPHGFESRLPVSMDGSCNGLQNFSAMLRDEVGGKATNLTANVVMEDIYKRVAEAATRRMQAAAPDEAGLIARWLKHGISRSVVKRAVMTTPYGVTKRSAVRYVIDDYLRKDEAPCFTKAEHYAAANLLMTFAWPAIGDVVVKSREAMDWLSTSAKLISKRFGYEREGVISWVTPSGFLASQAYFVTEEHRINTRIHGTTKIKVLTESEDSSDSRHASGLAPNFVHSMDASHLHLTAAAASAAGITSLAMIHDDYGTHAADAERLFHLIREQFVQMYDRHDPIKDFAEAYPICPTPPTRGTLDLSEVLRSDYFFS